MKTPFLAALAAVSITIPLNAQGVVADTIDLSKSVDTKAIGINRGVPIRLVLVNAIATAKYTVDIVYEHKLLAPLQQISLPEPITKTQVRTASPKGARDTCADILISAKGLDKASPEKAVATLVQDLREKAELRPCSGDTTVALEQRIRMLTEHTYALRALRASETVTITVAREKLDDGNKAATWSQVFSTVATGEWLTTYGFGFTKNDDDLYFAKNTPGVADKFAITQRDREQDYDMSTMIFFTFVPASWHPSWLSFGPTVGLGLAKDKVAAALGVSVGIGDNLWLTVGGSVHDVRVLNAKYHKGDVVATNLDDSALQTSQRHPFGFLSLSLRFKDNPFGGSTQEASTKTSSGANASGGASKQ